MRNNLSQLISLSKVEEKLYRPADAFEQSRVTRMEHVKTTIYETPREGISGVANHIANVIRQHDANGRNTVLSLASGRSMRDLFAELVRLHVTNEGTAVVICSGVCAACDTTVCKVTCVDAELNVNECSGTGCVNVTSHTAYSVLTGNITVIGATPDLVPTRVAGGTDVTEDTCSVCAAGACACNAILGNVGLFNSDVTVVYTAECLAAVHALVESNTCNKTCSDTDITLGINVTVVGAVREVAKIDDTCETAGSHLLVCGGVDVDVTVVYTAGLPIQPFFPAMELKSSRHEHPASVLP